MRLSPILPALLLLAACESKPMTATRVAAVPTSAMAAPVAAPPPVAAAADSAHTFSWQNMCTYIGSYAPTTYTRQQLAGTYQLVLGTGGLPTSLYLAATDKTPESFGQLATLLKHQHDSLAQVLHKTEVAPTAFWRQFKHLRELQLAEQYEQAQVELAAYFAPATLHNSRYYSTCPMYADALASTDTSVVLRAWRYLMAQQKINNADPAQFDKEYTTAVASPECLYYAHEKLLIFGLHNCLVSQSKYNELENQYQPLAKFEKLFQHVEKHDCVDVD